MGFYPSEGDVDNNGAEEVNLRTSAGAELLGQQVSAASLPVVIASNQTAVPISAASLPLPTGAATEATLSAVNTKTPALGQAVMASSTPVVIASDQTPVDVTIESSRATYSAAIPSLALALLATDVFTITGSATKTIKVTRISVSSTASIGTVFNLLVLKRSTANTGGTSTVIAAVPHDSASAAATATVRAYTANPTVGTLVGNVWAVKQIATTTSPTNPARSTQETTFSVQGKMIVLRGTSQVLAVNMNGVTLGSGNFAITVEWTEE